MSGSSIHAEKQTASRNRPNPVKKWLRNEEIAIVNFIKENLEFEKPTSRIYYNKFLVDTGVDADWKLVRSKVRNMRTAYRRAKEHEVNKNYFSNFGCDTEAVRNELLRICWYVNEFDVLFPNEMDSYIYKKTVDPSIDEEFPIQEFENNINNSSKNFNDKYLLEDELTSGVFPEKYLPEDELTSSTSSKSINGDILAVQNNMFNLKRQKHDKVCSIRQQELELARDKLNFEKEKFRQEVRLKEKEIESHERIKKMELQMKERIAMKELELKEKLAMKSMDKDESSNNVYHNMA